MKKRILSILLCLCLLLLFPGVLVLAECILPDFYADSYYAELPQMVNRLKKAEGKRLILLGSSSVAFGTDTALLRNVLSQNGFDYTVCPMGLYGAVGTDVMLDLTASQLRQGDLVVFTFEPTSESMSDYFGANAYWKCAESDPGLLLLADSSKRAALVGSYPGYLQERWAIWQSGQYPVPEGVYALASFDESCNMIYDRPGNTMLLGYDIGSPIDLAQAEISPEFEESVRRFCEIARKTGATVTWSFCPMNRSAIADDSPQALEDFFNRCAQSFGCTSISDPRDYVMDSGWFFDSNFHLNSAGAEVRTLQLAEDILSELGCYQPLSYEMPSMPEPDTHPQAESAGDDAFLFTPFSDGTWLISGLKEQGKIKRELTVPSSWDGLPVVGFTEDALAQAENLTQLRLPATIQAIPDGLFSSCTRLERLILEHTDAPCSITAHSLDGPERLRIFVPQAVYPMYRDGVGCEENLWQRYLNRIFTC